MDEPGLPDAEVAAAYRVLRRVNAQLGNLRVMRREMRAFLDELEMERGDRPVVLDVGSGSADVPSYLRCVAADRGVRVRALALDRDRTAVRLAAGEVPGMVVLGDAMRLPFADRSIDLVTCVKFAHHFHGEGLRRLLAEAARVASRRVVVLDIRRHWAAYCGFVAWSRLFTRNRLVRYDGPLSVLRGFTPEELRAEAAALTDFAWSVRRDLGFQLTLVGVRRRPAAQA